MKSKLIWLLILGIICLGFFLRAQETLSNNFLFLIDQGRDLMDVKKIVFNHNLTLIGPYTSLGGVFQGPLWYYLLAIPMFLGKGDPLYPMILMLLISMTVLVVGFFWLKKKFGLTTAIIGVYLLALCPEAIAAATYIWNPHPMWLLILFYIIFLNQTVSVNKKYQILVWLILALMFHFEAAFGVFLFLTTVIYLSVFKKEILKSRYLLYGMLVMFVLFLPQIIFELRHDFLMTRSVLRLVSGNDGGLFVGGENKGYLKLLSDHVRELVNNYKTSFYHDGYLERFPLLMFVVNIVILIYSKSKKIFSTKEKQLVTLLLAVLTIVLLISFVYPFPIRYWFLTGFQTFYIILSAVLVSKLWFSQLGKIVILGLFLLTFSYSFHRIDLLYFHPPDDGGDYKTKGKKAAIDYIYNDAKGTFFNVLVFTPPVYTFAYDYLFWWYGQNKYHFLPGNQKQGITYLLMEPDPDKPWSYEGWLQTVIKNGVVLKRVILPSGFVIEKRQFN